MVTISDLLKLLNAPQHQMSPVSLTLKNYFQFSFRPEEPLETDAVQSFIDHAMSFPHWQQNKKELAGQCRALIENLITETNLEPRWSDAFYWPDEMQVFEIEIAKLALEVLNNYFLFRTRNQGGQFKCFELQDKRYSVVVLDKDGSISVHQFDNKFVVRNGHLEPLRRDLILHYTPELSLETEIAQKIELSPFIVSRFFSENEKIYGHIVRGYVFQQIQSVQGLTLEKHPRLFFAIKRQESLFLRRESDPFYKGLVQELERLLHWMRIGEPIQGLQVHETYLKAQTALEEVFEGDKMLSLLLRDLEHHAAVASRNLSAENIPWTNDALRDRKTPSGLTKPSPTVAWPQGEKPTSLSPTVPSPSTVKKSTSSASKSIPRKTKFSWMESP
jgi:hypothetical protein